MRNQCSLSSTRLSSDGQTDLTDSGTQILQFLNTSTSNIFLTSYDDLGGYALHRVSLKNNDLALNDADTLHDGQWGHFIGGKEMDI